MTSDPSGLQEPNHQLARFRLLYFCLALPVCTLSFIIAIVASAGSLNIQTEVIVASTCDLIIVIAKLLLDLAVHMADPNIKFNQTPTVVIALHVTISTTALLCYYFYPAYALTPYLNLISVGVIGLGMVYQMKLGGILPAFLLMIFSIFGVTFLQAQIYIILTRLAVLYITLSPILKSHVPRIFDEHARVATKIATE